MSIDDLLTIESVLSKFVENGLKRPLVTIHGIDKYDNLQKWIAKIDGIHVSLLDDNNVHVNSMDNFNDVEKSVLKALKLFLSKKLKNKYNQNRISETIITY